jgi:ubiquinone/menaquinone biosynthesis C-methylase UbiE
MEYYDEIAAGYSELYREEQLKKYELISSHLGTSDDERILDVGCGMGFSSQVLKGRITGIDPARKMLVQEGGIATKNQDKIVGRAEFLPFKDKSFDVVICVTAIHNFEDPKVALEEMKRVGKNRGAVTIMKKAKSAAQLRNLVDEMFDRIKIVEEEKDTIHIYDAV